MVDISNLQRQVIHFTPDIGRPKVDSAKEKMNLINPDVNVTTYNQLFTKDNALDILANYDFVIDGTDSFPSKFLINDACVIAKKPFSHGGILRFDGQTMTHVLEVHRIVVYLKNLHRQMRYQRVLKRVCLVLLLECLEQFKRLKLFDISPGLVNY